MLIAWNLYDFIIFCLTVLDWDFHRNLVWGAYWHICLWNDNFLLFLLFASNLFTDRWPLFNYRYSNMSNGLVSWKWYLVVSWRTPNTLARTWGMAWIVSYPFQSESLSGKREEGLYILLFVIMILMRLADIFFFFGPTNGLEQCIQACIMLRFVFISHS